MLNAYICRSNGHKILFQLVKSRALGVHVFFRLKPSNSRIGCPRATTRHTGVGWNQTTRWSGVQKQTAQHRKQKNLRYKWFRGGWHVHDFWSNSSEGGIRHAFLNEQPSASLPRTKSSHFFLSQLLSFSLVSQDGIQWDNNWIGSKFGNATGWMLAKHLATVCCRNRSLDKTRSRKGPNNAHVE
jgi:hypothetical protein